MKKRTLKILILSLILALSVAFTSSCALLVVFRQSRCPHEIVNDGSCKTPGACAACGKPVGELGDHAYKKNIVYPDCVSGGYVDNICTVCGDKYRDDLTNPKGHTYGEWIFEKDPTATENGRMYRECTVCTYKESKSVPAHEHELRAAAASSATCTRDGWDEYEYCTICEYNTRVLIKATGHSWGAYASNSDSTHTRICANDPSHVNTEPCSGGDVTGSETPICAYCHTAYDFAARPGNSSYGYEALGAYPGYGKGMQKLYKDLTRVCEQFYTSNEDVTPDGDHYIIGRFDSNDYSLSLEAASAVWKIFYVSNPLYYWLDAKILSIGDTVLLAISDDYARAVDRREADAAIADMTEQVSLLVRDDMSDLEKTVTITAYIVENMEYAYEDDGDTAVKDMWAHCMAGFAMHGLGVCEAYAKSFMYLCLLNGVDCRMGSGYAGEPHAWNYVKIDGEWYGADITWTDNSGDVASYDHFGLSSEAIFKDHTPHSSTVLSGTFIYEAPTLSDKSIELAALYKNGEYFGLYKSIDEAFADMTDETAEYEIKVDYYAFFTTSPTYTLESTVTPDVKKLTITGRNEQVGPSHLDNNSIITLTSHLTLGSNVELRNLHLLSGSTDEVYEIRLAGHKLSLSGNAVYMEQRITGTMPGSIAVFSAASVSYVYGGVDVYKLITGSVGVMLGADSRITYCDGKKIYIPQVDSPEDKVKVEIMYQG